MKMVRVGDARNKIKVEWMVVHVLWFKEFEIKRRKIVKVEKRKGKLI